MAISVQRLNGQLAVELNGDTAINLSPIAVDGSASVFENCSVIIDVLSNDSDADSDPLSVAAMTATITEQRQARALRRSILPTSASTVQIILCAFLAVVMSAAGWVRSKPRGLPLVRSQIVAI